MIKQIPPSLKSPQQGVVIIEALIAILIFSIGVLGIVGMQANMVRNTSDSKYRTDASNEAQKYIGALWVSPTNRPPDPSNFSLSLANTSLPAGTITVTRNGVFYTVSIGWKEPGGDLHSFTTTASIAP